MARATLRGRGRGRSNKASRSTRSSGVQSSSVPDVYQEMLVDAASSSPTRLCDEGQTVKRRRIGGRVVIQSDAGSSNVKSGLPSDTHGQADDSTTNFHAKQQTAYEDSEESADSDVSWEEVGLNEEEKTEDSADEPGELDLVLGGEKGSSGERSKTERRKPLTAAERELRVGIHKMHLLSLLVHVGLRNYWCNDHRVQILLLKLLSKKTLSYLDDDVTQNQYQRSRSFTDGLQLALEAFGSRYKITTRGLQRPYWVDDAEQLMEFNLPDDIELPMQKEDFRAVATKLEASRDTGAQLFCALLRSAGVEARLVCSLQVLPFTPNMKVTMPVKPNPAITVKYPDTRTGIHDEGSAEAGSDTSTWTAGSSSLSVPTSRVISRLGGSGRRQHVASGNGNPTVVPSVEQAQRRRIRESPKPVYWVEAFNTVYQKWVPVDPLVTKTIGKPPIFEPPTSDTENNMTYVIAFEEDGSARDVTRRYAKAYNAKTRKFRVEVTKGGERWWRRVLRMYRRAYTLDRDQVEDTDLAAKEAAEGMPGNVQDFKDHPYYALERHLKRNEVIHPKREVGKIKASKSGTGGGSKMLEPVYRRQDVHIVKSGDSWYRLGREVKTGEQPLKRAQPRRRREALSEDGGSEDEEDAGTPMYAAFQTTPYTAPPVIHGMIPKNAYGNLDIYAPNMVPPGGVHIVHPDTTRAAKLLGIDYADAVTGFEFRGRHGTAVLKGAVVAAEYKEAVEEVIRGFEYERAEEEDARKSSNALKMWRLFLKGLRIRERIEGYAIEGESSEIRQEMEEDDSQGEEGTGGGFVPDAEAAAEAELTARQFYQRTPLWDAGKGGGFMAEEGSGDDGQRTDCVRKTRADMPTVFAQHAIDQADEGGFLPDVEDGDGVEDEDAEEALWDINRSDAGPIPSKSIPQSELDVANSGAADGDPLPLILLDHSVSKHEFAEARMVQQTFENEAPNASSNHTTEMIDTLDTGLSITPSPKDISDPVQGRNTPEPSNEEGSTHDSRNTDKLSQEQKSAVAAVSEENSETDKGSLLSHDPSDEDADPDWLV